MTEVVPAVEAVSQKWLPIPWAAGLFYRMDGNKKVLVPWRIILAVIAWFFVLSTVLTLFTPPKQSLKRGGTPVPPAVIGLQAAAMHHIPFVGTPGNGASVPVTSENGTNHPDPRHNSGGKSRGSGKRGRANAQTVADADLTYGAPQVIDRPRGTRIPPGVMIKAVLKSGASNGPVRAELAEPLAVNDEQLIEEGSMLVGVGSSTEERLFIRFNQVVSKDGTTAPIQAQACDLSDQIVGLKGSKVGNYALKLAAGMGLNFLGGMSEALQDSEGQNGAIVRRPTVRNALLNGSAKATLEQSNDILSSAKNQQPIIEIPAGTVLWVLTE